MQSTRNRILGYLEEHPRSSTAEISRYLDLTESNIRYHLHILLENGQILITEKRSPGGAGRPILLYNLASPTLGDNIYSLVIHLMDWIAQSNHPEETLRELAVDIVGQETSLPANRIKRYNQAIEFLDKRHYRASWEARADGPQVSLRHCPYQDLARLNPLICHLDEYILSGLFGREMNLTQRRHFGKDPFSPCIFNPPR